MTLAGGPTGALGVDVGGTFTDLALVGAGGVTVAKVPSTPSDQSEGVLAGIRRLGVDPADLARFVHGTTVATNTVLERDGARTVLVTTAGFGDLLVIGRQDRPQLYRLDAGRPPPVVERDLVVEVDERIGADGAVVAPLSDAEVERVTAAVAAMAPDAVAVSLLFSFLVSDHERRLVRALAPLGVPVSSSSELLPVLREVERSSTTALNAYVAPRIERYLAALEGRLTADGLAVPVEVMRSGGGTSTARVTRREPIHTLLSGPAAGAWGAAALGRATDTEDLIAFDVGGTSTDVTLIAGGRPATNSDGAIDGLPFAVTTTDIHTIGAGGGSLAWIDAGGALRVGPRSAGADPGPACYGRGGEQPTVTDADVVLGRLVPDVRLGGSMPLHPDRAREAVGRLADTLGLDIVGCAEGIVRVADAQMVQALRVVSVGRGRDPRSFSLLPFGGAGPLHQAALAQELGCRRVLLPPNPGVVSALGLLAAPVTVDRVRSRPMPLERLTEEMLQTGWDELADDARAVLGEQGVEIVAERRTADLRYRGQAFELEVGAEGPLPGPDALARSFHAAHLARYGYEQPEAEVELVTLRVRVEGPPPSLPLERHRAGGSARSAEIGRHRVVAAGGEVVEAPVIQRSHVGTGATLRGPAVLVGLDAVAWIAPWQAGEVDDLGILHLTEAAS